MVKFLKKNMALKLLEFQVLLTMILQELDVLWAMILRLTLLLKQLIKLETPQVLIKDFSSLRLWVEMLVILL